MTTTGRRLIACAIATCLVTVGAVVSGQQQAGRDDRSLSTGSVDFVVVTRDGTPVTDLRAEEITLSINRRPRPVKSLNYIRLAPDMAAKPSAAATTTGAAPGEPAPKPVEGVAPPYSTNGGSSISETPRLIVLVVDDESMPIGQEHRLRAALNSFVKDLPATDRVALVTVPHGGVKVPPTIDRERLRQAINEISPINPIEPEICRTRTTLSTLEATLSLLTRGVEQPVAVAIMSASLTGASRVEMAQKPSAATGGGGVSAQAGGCYLRTDDFVAVGAAAAASRAQVYVIHPDYNPTPVQEGIENLRSQTGAPLFHLASSAEPGLYRMARETSGYYVATFDTEAEERAAKPLPTSLQVSRQNVEVRARPYVLMGRAATPTAAAAAGPTVTTAFEMVRSGKSYNDLQLRATTAATQNADGTLNVLVVFEPAAGGTIMTAAASLIDANDKGVAYWPEKAELEKQVLSGPGPYAIGLTVMPGEYRLRIAAIDSTGRLGLVDDRITARLEAAGSLKLGGLMIGQNMGAGFVPKLQFSKESSAMAFLEVYGGVAGTGMGAIVEVANTTNGQAFYRVNGVISPTSEEGKYTVTATLPIYGFKPGDYVIRAIVGAADEPQGRVVRTLRKVQ